MNESTRGIRIRAARRADGKCTLCGLFAPQPGMLSCAGCLDRMAARNNKRYALLAARAGRPVKQTRCTECDEIGHNATRHERAMVTAAQNSGPARPKTTEV